MPQEIAGGCLRVLLDAFVELFIRDPLVWLFSKKGQKPAPKCRRGGKRRK